ncbi:hypothetical protein [Actinoplanes sp. NPDC049265]|uniref:hypothetical protein n=1 Tax=Actinoplanes sp. NPDC049265 TaxID=3363902 RepID=UPI00371D65EC
MSVDTLEGMKMLDQLGSVSDTLDAIVGDARRMLASHDEAEVREELAACLRAALRPEGFVAEHEVLLLAEAVVRLALMR